MVDKKAMSETEGEEMSEWKTSEYEMKQFLVDYKLLVEEVVASMTRFDDHMSRYEARRILWGKLKVYVEGEGIPNEHL